MSRVGVDLILPPLIQGIPLFHISSTSVHGFIPAHAGNTSLQRNRPWPWKVHPRSRGEYTVTWQVSVTELGSPPLTRGILCILPFILCPAGFTPAHAGNTNSCMYDDCSNKVHPRSRGEYVIPARLAIRMIGSPPLTRGILIVRASYPYTIRFTPAHAGNTGSGNLNLPLSKVHPRSRGEYT